MIAKRDEFRKGIRLLEARPPSGGELAAKRLIERLCLRVEWLDKRIETEMKTQRTDNAAQIIDSLWASCRKYGHLSWLPRRYPALGTENNPMILSWRIQIVDPLD
jgi:hypothetical protein